jgi:hypothetical protein
VSASPSPVPPGSDDWSGPPAPDGLYRAGGGLFDDATERLSAPTGAPPDADADADAAAEPDRVPRGRWAVLAVALAALALVAALASAAFAWQAFDRADDARTIAVRLQPIGSAASSTEPTVEPSAEPSDDPGLLLESSLSPDAATEPTDPATDGPTPAPAAGYQQEPMKFQVGCSAALFVDLDEPRANVDDAHHDLRYDSRCGSNNPTLALGPGADGGSQVGADTRTAADCEKQIRTKPLGPRAVVPVGKGLMLCVLTSLADARERDDTQKLVLLEVTGLSDRGTASLRATSWTIPE